MRRAPLLLGAAVTVLLVVFAGGYGYHRDELYFLEAGHHLAWSYADQGPVTPLVARLMSDIAPGSLTVLRIPSAIAAGLVVLLTGLLAGELGGRPRARALAATCAAVGTIVLFNGHLLSTSNRGGQLDELAAVVGDRALPGPARQPGAGAGVDRRPGAPVP